MLACVERKGTSAKVGSPQNLKMAKDYTRMKSSPVESFRKNLEMATGSGSLVRPRKREGLKIRPRLFQIDRVSN